LIRIGRLNPVSLTAHAGAICHVAASASGVQPGPHSASKMTQWAPTVQQTAIWPTNILMLTSTASTFKLQYPGHIRHAVNIQRFRYRIVSVRIAITRSTYSAVRRIPVRSPKSLSVLAGLRGCDDVNGRLYELHRVKRFCEREGPQTPTGLSPSTSHVRFTCKLHN
jgi:hypothetical protein